MVSKNGIQWFWENGTNGDSKCKPGIRRMMSRFGSLCLHFFFFYMAKNVKALALFKKKKLKKVLEDFRTLTKKKQICTEKHSLFLNSQYKRTRDLNSFNFCNFITGKNQKIRKVIFERNRKGRKNKRMNYGE